MRFKKAAIFSGILLLPVFSGWLAWLMASYREPVYQGKSLTKWVQEYNGHADAPASQALIHIGRKAAPWLARMLGARDTALRLKVAALLAKQKLVKFRLQPAGVLQDQGLKVVSMYGMQSSHSMVPELAALVRDYPGLVSQPNASLAMNALAEMGSNGIPILIEMLHHRDNSMRVQAAQLLGTAPATGGPEVVAALRECLGNPDPQLHSAASLALDLIQKRLAQPLPSGTTNWVESPLSSATDPVSIWHISKGVRLLSTSRLAPGDRWEELFGGHFSAIPSGERETFVYDAGHSDGYAHFVEWEMPAPVTLRSFGLICDNDGPGYSYMGSFRAFRLYARSDTNDAFALIYSEDFPVPVRVGLFNSVDFAFRNLPASVTARQFRAEFVQNGTGQYHGPRTKELFGFSEPLNSALMSRALLTLDPNTLGVAKLVFGDNLLEGAAAH